MAFDYKKEYKEFYLPKNEPGIVDVPEMRFAAVRGAGDPNPEGGAYARAVSLLYGVSFTLKMGMKFDRRVEGWFDYVVPPLEGFWWMDGVDGIDYARKGDFRWIAAIRLPDFVSEDDLLWAKQEAERKKKESYADVEWLPLREGLCVQCMHVGPYDSEPETVARMDAFAEQSGCVSDFSDARRHHEIYLSDARRCAPERLKTVIRHPIRRAN